MAMLNNQMSDQFQFSGGFFHDFTSLRHWAVGDHLQTLIAAMFFLVPSKFFRVDASR